MSKKDDIEPLNRFTSNVINVFEILTILFVCFFTAFAFPIIHLTAPGFKNEYAKIAVSFLRIISFSMFFKTISSIFAAYMQSNKTFIPVSMYGAIMDIVIIMVIGLSVKYGFMLLPYGVFAGLFVQMLFAICCALKTGFHYYPTLDILDSNLKSMLIMFLPAIAATGANQIIQLVNKGMATTVLEGGVTLISNANKMGYAAENIIVLSIAAVIYPTLSTCSANNDIEGFKANLRRGLNSTVILMIPLTMALIVYARPIIQILFGHGKYVDSVSYTALLMKIYCIGIVGLSSYTIMIRALYAQKMIMHSAACAIISLVVNIVLCVFLVKTMRLGLVGISMATSITYIFSCILSLCILHKKIGTIIGRRDLKIIGKTLLSCIPMLAFSYFIFFTLSKFSIFLALMLCAFGGVVSFTICMYLLKVSEVNIIIQRVKEKLLH